jgi:hypothetical protein
MTNEQERGMAPIVYNAFAARSDITNIRKDVGIQLTNEVKLRHTQSIADARTRDTIDTLAEIATMANDRVEDLERYIQGLDSANARLEHERDVAVQKKIRNDERLNELTIIVGGVLMHDFVDGKIQLTGVNKPRPRMPHVKALVNAYKLLNK